MRNAVLAYEVLDDIRKDITGEHFRGGWDQRCWENCFAGFTNDHLGYQIVGMHVWDHWQDTSAEAVCRGQIDEVAARALGLELDSPEAQRLFSFLIETYEDMEEVVLDVFGPRPKPVEKSQPLPVLEMGPMDAT